MLISMTRVGRVFGDRILVRKLERPEKVGSFFIPASYAKEAQPQQELWWGVVEKFGYDSRYEEAYGIKAGDIVGIDSMGSHSAAFDGDDGHAHVWVAEEFVVVKDLGLVAAFRDGLKNAHKVGLLPIGPYCVVESHPDEEKRGGVILPANSKQDTRTGTVLAVSDGIISSGDLLPLNVANGSDVIMGKYAGAKVKLGESRLVLVKEEDIIAEYLPAECPQIGLVEANA